MANFDLQKTCVVNFKLHALRVYVFRQGQHRFWLTRLHLKKIKMKRWRRPNKFNFIDALLLLQTWRTLSDYLIFRTLSFDFIYATIPLLLWCACRDHIFLTDSNQLYQMCHLDVCVSLYSKHSLLTLPFLSSTLSFVGAAVQKNFRSRCLADR